MKNVRSLFIELEKLKNEKGRLIDLTKKIDSALDIFTDGTYSDPGLKITGWCTVKEQGFLVSEIRMGTQTGTHIDAPSHFIEKGADLDSLNPAKMIGRYFYVDLNRSFNDPDIVTEYNGETVIFLSACSKRAVISEEFTDKLLSLNAGLLVIAGECEISGCEKYSFHKKVLSSGKFLVEDLEISSAVKINRSGFIIALPLRFTGVSGSPCRVLAIQDQI